MARTGTGYPVDNRNPDKLAQRVKRDLIWIVFGVAAAAVASAAAYALLPQ